MGWLDFKGEKDVAESNVQVAPRSEWKNLSTIQLYEVKSQLQNKYYDMRQINASFSKQFLAYIGEVEAIIKLKEAQNSQQ